MLFAETGRRRMNVLLDRQLPETFSFPRYFVDRLGI